MPNKALQQNRDDVLRYGESIGCDLLKAAVRPPKAVTVGDAIESVGRKVAAIFAELGGERAKRLDGSVIAEPAMSVLERALVEQYGEKAHDIAFHMADWNSDAAFVVAVHLFPERFTPEEIAAGVGLFLVHAPNHIRAACGLTGQYVWENFPDDDEGYQAEPGAAADGGGM